MEGCKGHIQKGHREKLLKVMKFRVFSGCFQGISGVVSGVSGHFQDDFGVFFPMPFPGMPFGPFQLKLLTPQSLTIFECDGKSQALLPFLSKEKTNVPTAVWLATGTLATDISPLNSCGDRCFLPFGPDKSHVRVQYISDTTTPSLP